MADEPKIQRPNLRHLEHFLIGRKAWLNRPVWRARASSAGGGIAQRGTRGSACGDRGTGTCLLSPPAPAGDAQDQRAIRVGLLWIRTFPGANPSGALRASKCVPDTFVFGHAKTNSPGAEWDERRSPEGRRPGQDAGTGQPKAGPKGKLHGLALALPRQAGVQGRTPRTCGRSRKRSLTRGLHK
jgi:hypothetical protein